MTHVTEQDLVLHYYGELATAEDRAVSAHLAECTGCRREFTRLQRVLGAIDDMAIAPELPDGF
jgi:anti-sigma factor RsiW